LSELLGGHFNALDPLRSLDVVVGERFLGSPRLETEDGVGIASPHEEDLPWADASADLAAGEIGDECLIKALNECPADFVGSFRDAPLAENLPPRAAYYRQQWRRKLLFD